MRREETPSLAAGRRELMAAAAESGFPGAWKLAHLSPCEIQLELAGYAERCRREAEIADFQAWLTGRYVLTAMHAPRRFPRRPEGTARRPRKMSDEEMKRAFAAMAAGRGKNGGC